LARNDGVKRDREVMHDIFPSLHAPLRVAGRGRGWGVCQLAPLAASLLISTIIPVEPAGTRLQCMPHHPRPVPAAARGEGSDRRCGRSQRSEAACKAGVSLSQRLVRPVSRELETEIKE
jgi:hypothetical protein